MIGGVNARQNFQSEFFIKEQELHYQGAKALHELDLERLIPIRSTAPNYGLASQEVGGLFLLSVELSPISHAANETT